MSKQNVDDYYSNDTELEHLPLIGDIVKYEGRQYKVDSIIKHTSGLEIFINDDLLGEKSFMDFDVLFVNPVHVEFVMSAERFKLKNKIQTF